MRQNKSSFSSRPTGYQRSRNLGLESLEDRNLMAGDIIANVVNGSLVIRGDEASNGVAIRAGAEPGQYFIVGLEAGGEATSVNGVDAVLVSGVTRGIRAGLGQGDDVFRLSDANVRGAVSVSAGRGNDHISIGGRDSDDRADDRANDRVANTRIRLGLNLSTGLGNDSVHVGGTRVGGGTRIATGRGADEVGVRDSNLGHTAIISTGGGEDAVNVGGSRSGLLVVDTGAHDDSVRVVDSAFASLVVTTKTGDDVVGIFGVSARSAVLLGGRGTDELVGNNNMIHHVFRHGFENSDRDESFLTDDGIPASDAPAGDGFLA